MDDAWNDAELVDVYLYIRRGSRHAVPNSWEIAMNKLDEELKAAGLEL